MIDVQAEEVVWTLEEIIMGHNYLYYVLGCPVISDYMFDHLKRQANSILPITSCINNIGSSLPGSYTPRQVACGCLLKSKHIWT